MEPDKKKSGLLFFLLLVFSLFLRLIRLNQGLWYDEIHTLMRFVRQGYWDIITSLPAPNNHILYSLLAKLSLKVFGEKEWSFRLPSFLLGGFTPPIIYLLLRKRFKDFSAFLASLFLTFSFWAVWFSQDARGYAGFILFSALSNILYLFWLEHKNQKTAFWYIICTVISFYFYFYTGFIIAGQIVYGIWSLCQGQKGQKIQDYFLPVISLCISLCLYSPVLDQLLTYYQLKAKDISGKWLDLIFLKELIGLLAGTHYFIFGICALVLFVLGLFRLYQVWPGLLFLYLFPTGLIIFSTWVLRIFIFARFLAFLIPFFYLGIALALEMINDFILAKIPQLKKSYFNMFATFIICIFLSISLVRYYQLGKQGLKEAERYISRFYPTREVISFGLAGYEYLYYDRYAKPHSGSKLLKPEELKGKLVVASHSWSWSKENQALLKNLCTIEKEFLSAGYEEYKVYIFRCF